MVTFFSTFQFSSHFILCTANVMNIYKRLLPFVFPLFGFVFIVLAMNGYQYFKLKREVGEGLIRGIGEAELQELKSFFSETEELTLLIRDWGKNDVLFGQGIDPLNKKFIPLIARQKTIDGLTLAGEKGHEYLLYQDGDLYISRLTADGSQQFSELNGDAVENRRWKEQSSYDPKKEPWYEKSGSGDKVYWTDVYTLPEIKRPGLTASISYSAEEQGAAYVVSAVHVSLERLENILSSKREERPGGLFLVRPDKSFLNLENRGENNKQQEAAPETIEKLIAQWVEKGQPLAEVIRVQSETEGWVATFYGVGKAEDAFWVGVVAQNRELVGWLDRSFISVDIIEFLVAIAGGVLILVFMQKSGMIRLGRKKGSRLKRLHDYLEQGEGARVEYKSTVRKNLKSGKVGKEIEFAWLKAVVAFLNSEGGCLLLGVSDEGEILGLADDEFDNNDRCLLHVKNLFNQYVGAEFSRSVTVSLVEQEKGDVVMIECGKSKDPVFLRVGKNEEFYIRSGPSSLKLSPSQIVNYLGKNS